MDKPRRTEDLALQCSHVFTMLCVTSSLRTGPDPVGSLAPGWGRMRGPSRAFWQIVQVGPEERTNGQLGGRSMSVGTSNDSGRDIESGTSTCYYFFVLKWN